MVSMNAVSEKKVLVCANFRANPNHPSCGARESNKLFTALSDELKDIPISIEKSPCMGLCDIGPNVRLVPSGKCINEASLDKLVSITEEIKAFIAY